MKMSSLILSLQAKELRLSVCCNRPLSHGGHFESQENKKLCFCTSSLALDERLDVQNLLFQQCMIKVYWLYFVLHGTCIKVNIDKVN